MTKLILPKPKQDISVLSRRYFYFPRTDAEAKSVADRFQELADAGANTHVAPKSCLIAAMGTYWHPGCSEAVDRMAKYTRDRGIQVHFYEEHDRCYRPYDALGVMRDMAYMKAIREGWEFLLYIDNDIIPPQDALFNLLVRDLPILSPIVVYSDGEEHGMAMPKMERGHGLTLVSSCVLSFLLFKVVVFLPWWNGGFWDNPLGADESFHFAKFYQVGHRPFVDTDVVVSAQSPPHFPLDVVGRKREDLDVSKTEY